MWVKVEEDFYNTDHILSVERKEDAGVYYSIRFADGKETGFNVEQIQPLIDAVAKMAEQADNKTPEDKAKPTAPPAPEHAENNAEPVSFS